MIATMVGSRHRGFTLLELIVALVLLALLSGVLFGSVKLAGRSTDGGEAKAAAAASMRLAQQFLRANLEAQHPLQGLRCQTHGRIATAAQLAFRDRERRCK